ncbi:WDR21 family WD repeat protein [Schizosaccharomyces japonicus yFS275]|uniref:WDR21 family WD repeat protein n=1 Tax=Schizosaccharomyces japonicus (strain yFS275 / FY16936) TaxID=402676 RepID=B6JY22_SCHJY|nr:WDR21 family WD repeat protein [Schizosaccharomyces japonicus yFS275]EEB06440.1 WDR21 family WD repeat protein [Schizosaccharomyces japonicus yFS275]
MVAPHIPGFVFDEARNRYFRLQSATQANPSSMEYTVQHVRQVGREQKRKRKANQVKRQEEKKNKKPPPTMYSMLLNRSLGGTMCKERIQTKFLDTKSTVQFSNMTPQDSITHMATPETSSEILLVGTQAGLVCATKILEELRSTDPETTRLSLSAFDLSFSQTGISSVQISEDGNAFWTTKASGNASSKAFFSRVNFLNELEVQSLTTVSTELIADIQCSYKIRSSNSFALGGCNRIALFDAHAQSMSNILHTKSEVFSLQGMHDANTAMLYAGLRNRNVLAIDTRQSNRRRAAVLCRHVSSVCNMRVVTPSQPKIIVCGLDCKMALYDLRFIREHKSEPLVQYVGYGNEYQRVTPLSVDETNTTILAAGEKNVVRFWSLEDPLFNTEHVLNSPDQISASSSTWFNDTSRDEKGWMVSAGSQIQIFV